MSSIVESAPSVSSSHLRILVVEDESLVALDLEERLIRLGHEVIGVVDNGVDALRAIQANPADLVLMDIHIRGASDGIQTAAELRKVADVPVVYLTAHADEATLQRAGETEPFGYVLKPFDERELRAAIQVAYSRHSAEARLQKMERWLATTLRSIGDGVIAADRDGRVTFVNAAAETVSGWRRAEALGRHLSEVFVITTASSHDETTQLLHRTMTDGVIINLGEGRCLRTRDGRLVAVDDSFSPIRDDQGRVSGCVVIFRDNTARLAADEERRRLEAKMQEAQRLESLGIMAGGIAHDFNNLLTAVMCNASLIRSSLPADVPFAPQLRDIEAAAERAALLCRQLLDYTGQGKAQLREVELSAFTRDTAQLLQVVIHKQATLVLDLGRDLPPLRADRSQLQQIIMNLVINGSEAIDGQPGVVTVRTRRFAATRAFLSGCRVGADSREGEYLLLEVSDTGHGMTPEVLSRIFDPFFTTKFTGRGLGLAAISGIVRTHGGALAVESAPGVGTKFQVLFPPILSSTAELPSPPHDPAWRSSGLVLVVDDEHSIRLTAAAALRHLGFEVETAEDGLQAVEKTAGATSEYILVLLDLTMPNLDGRAAFQEIRARRPALPILLMSGYSDEQMSRIFELAGPVAFIQKPFSLGDLSAKLQPLLAR